jgi:hypothetical protein
MCFPRSAVFYFNFYK